MANQRNLYGVVQFDVAGSGSRDSRLQTRMREDLHGITERLLVARDVDPGQLSIEDRGDQLRMIIPLTVMPPDRIVDVFVPGLVAELRENSRAASPAARIRLRLCIDIGLIEPHQGSWAGVALVRATRLLEAAPVRAALRANPEADLAVVLSDQMYEMVVRHRFGLLDPDRFERIRVHVKEFDADAWLLVPEPSGRARLTAAIRGGTDGPEQATDDLASPLRSSGQRPDWVTLMHLVDLMLEVSVIADERSRHVIVRQLRSDVRGAINRHPAARVDVTQILTTCFDYSGAIRELVSVITALDGHSTPVVRLASALAPYAEPVEEKS
jgi:hypothetical protein